MASGTLLGSEVPNRRLSAMISNVSYTKKIVERQREILFWWEKKGIFKWVLIGFYVILY